MFDCNLAFVTYTTLLILKKLRVYSDEGTMFVLDGLVVNYYLCTKDQTTYLELKHMALVLLTFSAATPVKQFQLFEANNSVCIAVPCPLKL